MRRVDTATGGDVHDNRAFISYCTHFIILTDVRSTMALSRSVSSNIPMVCSPRAYSSPSLVFIVCREYLYHKTITDSQQIRTYMIGSVTSVPYTNSYPASSVSSLQRAAPLNRASYIVLRSAVGFTLIVSDTYSLIWNKHFQSDYRGTNLSLFNQIFNRSHVQYVTNEKFCFYFYRLRRAQYPTRC